MTASTGPDDLLTPGEVAAYLRVDPKTVTRWAIKGRIPSTRTPGGHRRYRRADVEAANGRSLNNLLFAALHTAQRIAFEHTGDMYTVTAWDGTESYAGYGLTPAEALNRAMRRLAFAREQAKADALIADPTDAILRDVERIAGEMQALADRELTADELAVLTEAVTAIHAGEDR